MTRPGPAHPLDVELADLADGALAADRAAALDAHLEGCLLCRLKLGRLRHAPPPGPPPPRAPACPVAVALPAGDPGADPAPGDLWLAGGDDRLLVALLSVGGDRALAAPVTLDVGPADDEAVVIDDSRSPLGLPLAVYPSLAIELPRAALAARVATGLDVSGRAGPPVAGATDPRLEI
ncbi:MAG TPA: hypothetical protein VM263_07845, partial [Acidimicrobiales bacterium]|nr:hypothetical protein [Acidimicrobiales bacterium]